MATGTNTADLDFDSVQRGNPEIERRAQEVIDRCWQLGDKQPDPSIHDVGAGGLSNALPGAGQRREHAAGVSNCATIPDRRAAACRRTKSGRNEAQERYVLAIAPADLPRFQAICERERCPFAVVGEATAERAS